MEVLRGGPAMRRAVLVAAAALLALLGAAACGKVGSGLYVAPPASSTATVAPKVVCDAHPPGVRLIVTNPTGHPVKLARFDINYRSAPAGPVVDTVVVTHESPGSGLPYLLANGGTAEFNYTFGGIIQTGFCTVTVHWHRAHGAA